MAHDLNALAPSSVTFRFPRRRDGAATADFYVYAQALSLLALPEYRGVSGNGRTHLFHSSAVAVDAASVVTNEAELQALAAALARAFYLWLLADDYVLYNGVDPLGLPSTGLETVEVRHDLRGLKTALLCGPQGEGRLELLAASAGGSVTNVFYGGDVWFVDLDVEFGDVTVNVYNSTVTFENVTFNIDNTTINYGDNVTIVNPPSGPGQCGPADINYPRHLHCGDEDSVWRRWYTSDTGAHPAVGDSSAYERTCLLPFVAPREAAYGKIAIWVSATATGPVRLGIYKARDTAGGDLYPGDLVVDAGLVDPSATTGRKELDIDVTLVPCVLYWLAFRTSNSKPAVRVFAGAQFFPVLGMDGNFAAASFGGALSADTAVAISFPAVWEDPVLPAGDTDTVPIVALQLKCPFDAGDCFCDFGGEGGAQPDALDVDFDQLAGDGDCDCLDAQGDTLNKSAVGEPPGWSGGLAVDGCGMLVVFLRLYCRGDGIEDWRLDWSLDHSATHPACDGTGLYQFGTARVLTEAPFAPTCDPFSMYFEIEVDDECCNGDATAPPSRSVFRLHFTEQ